MDTKRHSEPAFEAVIKRHLLANGYVSVPREGFDRERAIFPDVVLAFIRETQPVERARREAPRTATERSIALLEERRAALISAAVTGQIDIGVF